MKSPWIQIGKTSKHQIESFDGPPNTLGLGGYLAYWERRQ